MPLHDDITKAAENGTLESFTVRFPSEDFPKIPVCEIFNSFYDDCTVCVVLKNGVKLTAVVDNMDQAMNAALYYCMALVHYQTISDEESLSNGIISSISK